MFERFTGPTREVVTLAVEEAGMLHSGFLGCGHLLLGLLREGHGIGAQVLTAHGTEIESARVAVSRSAAASGPRDPGSPRELLGAIGIDLDEVLRRTEETFGPAAVGRAVERSLRKRRRRTTVRPRCTGGRLPFSPRAKRALELSLRESIRLGHSFIGTEHVLLGVLRDAESPPPRRTGRRALHDPGLGPLLREWGLSPVVLRAAVERRLRQAG